MSKSFGRLLGRAGLILALALALALAGGSCKSAPTFHGDSATMPCSPPGNHTIPIDDFGGVHPSDNCVEISKSAGHWVQWTSGAGKDATIAFILSKNQKEPFQRMSCSPADSKGNRLCVLIDCPSNCKTVFRSDYVVVDPESSDLNYYAYAPGVTDKLGGGARQGDDPGIRIKR